MLTLVRYRPMDSLLQTVPVFQYIETPKEQTKNKATIATDKRAIFATDILWKSRSELF